MLERNMNLFELIKYRRSIRKYEEQQIRREDLEKIIEAGLYAPNAGGGQRSMIVALRIKNKEVEELLKNKNSGIENVIYNLMFYLGRYSVWEDWFPNEFENGKHFSEGLKKYLPLVDVLFDLLKNTKNSKIEYENIKKHINYFKGMYVNFSN